MRCDVMMMEDSCSAVVKVQIDELAALPLIANWWIMISWSLELGPGGSSGGGWTFCTDEMRGRCDLAISGVCTPPHCSSLTDHLPSY
jgi:hypothetical protein